mgnify:CR=1 FL=1
MKYIQTLTEKGKLKWQDSDAPDANGRFRDLSPKDLAAWLIKTRKGDMKKISGSLSQQVAFNKNDDPEYAKKMDKTRKEVYKQLDREDLLDKIDESLQEPLYNSFFLLEFQKWVYKNRAKINRMSKDEKIKYLEDNYIKKYGKTHLGSEDLKGVGSDIYHSMVLDNIIKESVLNEEDTWNDYPAAAKKNAQKAIDWKEEHGRDEVDAGTPVGWARAHQLAKGENLSTDTVKRMSAFNRHRKNSSIKPELKETPWKDRGYVAWLIWGGDEGVDWAIEKSKEIDAMKESNQLKYIKPLNEAEKYITDEFKVGDKIKTNFGEWEVIETDYAPNKSFTAPFIFKGKDMERVNIPNPPKTNKKAVGYKVTDGDKYPIIGFLYQYKDITKLATVGVDESVVNEEKIKYAKGKTYQSSGHWTVYVDSNSSGFDIRVNHSAGWRLDPHDEKEETLELLDNGRQRATIYFKSGNIDKFAQKMFDLNDRTSSGNQTKLTAKDYADIIRVWIDMKMANESIVNEWGSSDQNIFNKSMHKEMGSPRKMPSPFDDKLRDVAADNVDHYWDDWEEYDTDRDGLIDNAVRGYLRSFFKKDFEMMQKMFASNNITEGMSKSAIKKAIKVIDKQIDTETGGDGEPLDNETLQALEQERERLQAMNESKFSPIGYAKRVISGEITLKDAMKEAGVSFNNLSKLILKLDKGFDIDAAVAENTRFKHLKSLNEYYGKREHDDFEKEFGKIKYPKWIKVKMKELVDGMFINKVYAKPHNYMSLWLNQMGKRKFNTDDRKKELGEVGYKLTDRYWNDLTGHNAFKLEAAEAAMEVSKHIEDMVANKESVEPAYYLMKNYFNTFGMQTDRSRIFNMAVEILEEWMTANAIETL